MIVQVYIYILFGCHFPSRKLIIQAGLNFSCWISWTSRTSHPTNGGSLRYDWWPTGDTRPVREKWWLTTYDLSRGWFFKDFVVWKGNLLPWILGEMMVSKIVFKQNTVVSLNFGWRWSSTGLKVRHVRLGGLQPVTSSSSGKLGKAGAWSDK